MRAWVVLLVCGCNRIFGLADVTERHVDAQYFDSPLDAAPTCPSGTAPVFRHVIHQVDAQNCSGYTPSEVGIAVAICNGVLAEGPTGGSLQPASIQPPFPVTDVLDLARISPEGDFALVLVFKGSGVDTVDLRAMNRDLATDTWTVLGSITIPTTQNYTISAMSRGPQRHAIFMLGNTQGAYEAHEYVGSGTTWTDEHTYTASDLGSTTIFGSPAVTPDGLHMIVNGDAQGQEAMYFYARPDVTSLFSTRTLIDSVPSELTNPYLTEDCGTLYLDALDTVLYYQQ